MSIPHIGGRPRLNPILTTFSWVICASNCRYEGVAFSGWFNGVWEAGYAGHNVTGSVHPQCLADHNASTAWHCTLPQVAATYVKTPLFAFNAKYDAFQIPNMMQDCFGNVSYSWLGLDLDHSSRIPQLYITRHTPCVDTWHMPCLVPVVIGCLLVRAIRCCAH